MHCVWHQQYTPRPRSTDDLNITVPPDRQYATVQMSAGQARFICRHDQQDVHHKREVGTWPSSLEGSEKGVNEASPLMPPSRHQQSSLIGSTQPVVACAVA
jgi:hypothetical protein